MLGLPSSRSGVSFSFSARRATKVRHGVDSQNVAATATLHAHWKRATCAEERKGRKLLQHRRIRFLLAVRICSGINAKSGRVLSLFIERHGIHSDTKERQHASPTDSPHRLIQTPIFYSIQVFWCWSFSKSPVSTNFVFCRQCVVDFQSPSCLLICRSSCLR